MNSDNGILYPFSSKIEYHIISCAHVILHKYLKSQNSTKLKTIWLIEPFTVVYHVLDQELLQK